jgi:hypothetical protein
MPFSWDQSPPNANEYQLYQNPLVSGLKQADIPTLFENDASLHRLLAYFTEEGKLV